MMRHRKVKKVRIFASVILVFAIVLFAFSFAGVVHPIGDSLAVARLPLSVFLIGLVWFSVFPKSWRFAITAIGLAGVVQILGPSAARTSVSDYDFVLYQQNLLFNRQDTEAWLQEIEVREVDFLTLQEVFSANASMLPVLAEQLPSQLHCGQGRRGGVAVLSAYPVIEGSQSCFVDGAMGVMQVQTPYGPIWIISIHLRWPWPFEQAGQVERMVQELERLDGHKILAGDFNSVRWSSAVRRIAVAGGMDYVGPNGATFHVSEYVPLGIDHVMTSPAFAQDTQIMPKLGSDHNGVLAFLARPQQE